jgi:RNA 2',3'-cyclic 3'-phosphodiesterase
MDLRCFIAIGIPEPIRKEIHDLLNILKKYDTDIKWVVPENIHVTLKFLGDTAEGLLPGIVESLRTVASSLEPFYIKIYGTGLFPDKKFPRVIWIGIEHSEMLMKLHADVDQSMSLLGYQKEGREFQPHLTLGRIRARKGIIPIVNELDTVQKKDFGTFQVDMIKLMKSELHPKGSKYTSLYDIPFKNYP